jgi:chromosomal replication initiator protein
LDVTLWKKCLDRLESELPEQQFNTWIRPLHAISQANGLRLLAPNHFVLDQVQQHFFEQINRTVAEFTGSTAPSVQLEVGARRSKPVPVTETALHARE